MTAGLLEFSQVSFGYPGKGSLAIRDFHYSLQEGRNATILGPNGAGKTTLLFLALGWLRPQRGEILLCGRPIEQISRRAMGRHVALIPQSEHIPFEYSVLEYVLLGRAPYLPPLGAPTVLDEEIAMQALEMAGIANLYDQSILALSGGERQLVLAARALAQEPRLLLMDEPTAHLDLSNKHRLLGILLALKKRGVTILMTTHEPELAFAASDEIILMEKGRVVTSGPAEAVATGANLSRIYQVPVKVVPVEGKNMVLWM